MSTCVISTFYLSREELRRINDVLALGLPTVNLDGPTSVGEIRAILGERTWAERRNWPSHGDPQLFGMAVEVEGSGRYVLDRFSQVARLVRM